MAAFAVAFAVAAAVMPLVIRLSPRRWRNGSAGRCAPHSHAPHTAHGRAWHPGGASCGGCPLPFSCGAIDIGRRGAGGGGGSDGRCFFPIAAAEAFGANAGGDFATPMGLFFSESAHFCVAAPTFAPWRRCSHGAFCRGAYERREFYGRLGRACRRLRASLRAFVRR